MTLHARTATMLLIALSIASNGWAQPPAEAREAVERMVEPGEMVTVTTVRPPPG